MLSSERLGPAAVSRCRAGGASFFLSGAGIGRLLIELSSEVKTHRGDGCCATNITADRASGTAGDLTPPRAGHHSDMEGNSSLIGADLAALKPIPAGMSAGFAPQARFAGVRRAPFGRNGVFAPRFALVSVSGRPFF